jgi:hypothetical protein
LLIGFDTRAASSPRRVESALIAVTALLSPRITRRSTPIGNGEVSGHSRSPVAGRSGVAPRGKGKAFEGLVVGARCRLSMPPQPDNWDGNGQIDRDFDVPDVQPITLSDTVVGSEP